MHSSLEKNNDRTAGNTKQYLKRSVQNGHPAGCMCARVCACVEGSCGGGFSENDNREVNCGYFVKCIEYDVKDIGLIL